MDKSPILIIASEYRPSVTPRGIYMHALSHEFSKRRETDVLTVKYSRTDKIDKNIDYSIVRTGSEGAKLRNALGFNKEASKLIRKKKYSHIIASSWEYAGTTAYNINKKTEIPYSLILFDREFARLKGRANLLTKFRMIEEQASNIFTINSLTAALLKKTGIQSEKIENLSYGPPVIPGIKDISISRDAMIEKYNIQHPRTILFSHGNTDEGSSFDILLWGVFLLKQSTSSFSLFLSGDGKNREKLELIVKDLKLDEHVRFVDDEEDSISLFSLCDIFLTLYKSEKKQRIDAYHPDVLTAMANSKVIVASNYGNIKEYVVQGKTGFVTPPSQPKEISSALKQIMSSREKRLKFGEQGKLFQEKHFNWDEVVNTIIRRIKDSN